MVARVALDDEPGMAAGYMIPMAALRTGGIGAQIDPLVHGLAQRPEPVGARRHRLAEGHEFARVARAAKDFPRSDAIRDELAAFGVEVMDGDPLGWDWKVAP